MPVLSLFTEETILSPLNCLCTFVRIQLTTYVWVYSCTPESVPLIDNYQLEKIPPRTSKLSFLNHYWIQIIVPFRLITRSSEGFQRIHEALEIICKIFIRAHNCTLHCDIIFSFSCKAINFLKAGTMIYVCLYSSIASGSTRTQNV